MSVKPCSRALLLLVVPAIAACATGPTYWRVKGSSGAKEPAESISFETRDYDDLAVLFVEELEKNPLYAELRGDPRAKTTPAIAHREFKIDISDRNTKAEIMEERIRVELQRAGVRYIKEQERQDMIDRIKLQQSDLNDQATAAQFGKFANAKYYLVGKLFEVTHTISADEKKREFRLVVDLLDLETLVSVFVSEVAVTKYIER